MSLTGSAIDRNFGVTSAPDSRVLKLSPRARRLTLDIIEITVGTNAAIRATLTELVPSFREIEIISDDANAVDTFTAGRQIRGKESGQHATVISQRTASSKHYLQYDSGSRAAFFEGEVVEERNLTGSATAAHAIVNSQPTLSHIEGELVADTTALSADGVVDISPATQADPSPNKPRLVRLTYTIAGAPTSASWVLRVS